MYTGDELCAIAVALVVFQQELPRFLVERRFRVGVDEETFDGNKDMSDSVFLLPILLQSIDTNLLRGVVHVGVEDFRHKPA